MNEDGVRFIHLAFFIFFASLAVIELSVLSLVSLQENLYLVPPVKSGSYAVYKGFGDGVYIVGDDRIVYTPVFFNVSLNVSVVESYVDRIVLRVGYRVDVNGSEDVLPVTDGEHVIELSRSTATFTYEGVPYIFPMFISYETIGRGLNMSFTSVEMFSGLMSIDLYYNLALLEVRRGGLISKLDVPPYMLSTWLIMMDYVVTYMDEAVSLVDLPHLLGIIHLTSDADSGLMVGYSGVLYVTVFSGYVLQIVSLNIVDTNVELSRPDPFTWDYFQFYKRLYAIRLSSQYGEWVYVVVNNLEWVILASVVGVALLIYRRRARTG